MAGELGGVFVLDNGGGVFAGAGFDSCLGVAAGGEGADGVGLGAAEGAGLDEGMAEFMRDDAFALGVEVDEDAGFFAWRGLDEEASSTGSAEGLGVGIEVGFVERDKLNLFAEEALHGSEVAELLGGVGLGEFADISAGEFDIQKHAGGIGGAGFGAALLDSSKSVDGSAECSKASTEAEHIGGGFFFVGIEGEGYEGGVECSAFDCATGYSRGSADALHDEGIG